MGSSCVLQPGWCLLGVTLAVLTFIGVEAAVISKDTRDLERFFLGRLVNPVCFHNLAVCKIGCDTCEKCYHDYVECGLASYKTATTTTTSSTVNVDAGTTPEADSLFGGAGVTQDPSKNSVRIPIVTDATSWKGVFVSKVRLAISEAVGTTTTTEVPSEHESDAPRPGQVVQSPGSKGQSTLDSKEQEPSSGPRGSPRNTTDSPKRRKHHYHHLHHKATAGDSKEKPNLANNTASVGKNTMTTNFSVEPLTPHLPHNTSEDAWSHDHHPHSVTTEATTTPFRGGDGSRDKTTIEDSSNLDHSATVEADEKITESSTRPHSAQDHTSDRTEPPRDGNSTASTTKPHHHHHKHSPASTGKPHNQNEHNAGSTATLNHDGDTTTPAEPHSPHCSLPTTENPSSSWTTEAPPLLTPTGEPLW